MSLHTQRCLALVRSLPGRIRKQSRWRGLQRDLELDLSAEASVERIEGMMDDSAVTNAEVMAAMDRHDAEFGPNHLTSISLRTVLNCELAIREPLTKEQREQAAAELKAAGVVAEWAHISDVSTLEFGWEEHGFPWRAWLHAGPNRIRWGVAPRDLWLLDRVVGRGDDVAKALAESRQRTREFLESHAKWLKESQ